MHASVLETILSIGLIAGGGKLPKHIITAAKESGYELSVIGIKNFANIQKLNFIMPLNSEKF